MATSIRVEENLLRRFQDLAAVQDKSMNEAISDSIRQYVENQPGVPDDAAKAKELGAKQIAKVFAANIAEVLIKDTSWADTIIRSTRLSWPGGLLDERMMHNALEKDFLGRKFALWFAARIRGVLEDRSVYLFVDAGSTNLYVCRHLWEHLEAISQESRATGITIVSNNEPVAEAFAARKQDGHLGQGTKIECLLLGGQIEPEYGAVVGKWTEAHLEQLKELDSRPELYMVLAAGNFVRLSGERPCYPIPLVRGRNQKPIKDLYISLADEVFLVAPLSKLFLHTTGEINGGMHFSKDAASPREQPYTDVNVAPATTRIKLITTVRESHARLLHSHSVAVRTSLGVLEEHEPVPTLAIDQVNHIWYPYEEHVKELSFEAEILAELAHGRTRVPEFRARFYGAP